MPRAVMRRCVLACVAVLGVTSRREAEAQVVRDPLGPLACFEIAVAQGLANQTALELCAGAISSAPGQCFALANARQDLASQQIVELCRRATSTEPLACFEELEASGGLTNDQMVGYCATRCAVGPAPSEVNNAACFAGAVETMALADQQARELCLGSQSTAPVQCFAAGEDVTALTELQLIQLCGETRSCQYVTAPATATY